MSEKPLRIARVCVDLLPNRVISWVVSEDWIYIGTPEDVLGDLHPLQQSLNKLRKAFKPCRTTLLHKDSLPGERTVFLEVRPDGWSWHVQHWDARDGDSMEVLRQTFDAEGKPVIERFNWRVGRLLFDGNKSLAPAIERVREVLQEHVAGPRKPPEPEKAPVVPEPPEESPESAKAVQEPEVEMSRGGFTKAEEEAQLQAAFGGAYAADESAAQPPPEPADEEPDPVESADGLLTAGEAARVTSKNLESEPEKSAFLAPKSASLSGLTPVADPPGKPASPPATKEKRRGRPPGSKNKVSRRGRKK